MRYAIFGLFVFLTGCESPLFNTDHPFWTAKSNAADRAEWDDIGCAIGTSFGSISTTDDRRHVSVDEAKHWCRAMRQGQPYTPVTNSAPVVRVEPAPAPRYICDDWSGQVRCRPE